jgi:hypothetical protein
MDAKVIHDNNRFGGRKWLHLIQEAHDKCVEKIGIKGSFNNVTVYNAVV